MNSVDITSFESYRCCDDWTPAVIQALEQCGDDTVLSFSRGTYHFYDRRADEDYLFIANHDHSLKKIAFLLEHRTNLVIDGEGSEFLFHGRMIPFALKGCSGITLKNFTVDYPRPFYTEGTVIEADHEHVDLKIDKDLYPYRIEDHRIVFCDPETGWESDYIKWFIEFDPKLHRPAWHKGGSDTRIQRVKAEQREHGVVRFKADFREIHRPGHIINMTHEHRWNPGIFLEECDGITVENVTIHHAGAMGVIGQTSRDISLKNYRVEARPGSGRMVSTNNDASHFVNCEGSLTLENCVLRHQLDDGVNIHGIYSILSRILPDNVVELETGHFQQRGVTIYRPGDRIALVDRETHLEKGYGRIDRIRRVNESFLWASISWEEGAEPSPGDCVSNYGRMPSVRISRCEFRDNRARGILVSTNKEALIEENDFYTSGSSICCGGEMEKWFESGPVRNLAIRNNRFHHCGYADWGVALISVNTKLKRIPEGEWLHEGLFIEGNTFDVVEPPVLYALSMKNIVFSGNILRKSAAFEPFKGEKEYLSLISCTGVTKKDNSLEGIEGEVL